MYVSSIRLHGVRFYLFPDDHEPRHAHAEYGESQVVVELGADGDVCMSRRFGQVQSANARRSDVNRILIVAAEYFDVLTALWEQMHP